MSVRFNMKDIKAESVQEDFRKIIDRLSMLEVIKHGNKEEDDKSLVYQIGLNPMLSPCFCISYRSPFLNSVTVNAYEFYNFLISEEEIDLRFLARKRFKEKKTDLPSLFSEIDE